MGVLKNKSALSAMKEAVVLDLGDIGMQAAKMRMQAETKAAKIVTEAEVKAKVLVENAHNQGYEEGLRKGLQQGEQRGYEEGLQKGYEEAFNSKIESLQQVQVAWGEVMSQWEDYRNRMEVDSSEAVMEFTLKLAERLVHRVIEVDHTVIVDQVANALSYILKPLDVTVQINADDRQILEEAIPELMAEFRHLKHIELVEGKDISRGGCLVQYGRGEIDAQIETQLERVIDMILPEGPIGGVDNSEVSEIAGQDIAIDAVSDVVEQVSLGEEGMSQEELMQQIEQPGHVAPEQVQMQEGDDVAGEPMELTQDMIGEQAEFGVDEFSEVNDVLVAGEGDVE